MQDLINNAESDNSNENAKNKNIALNYLKRLHADNIKNNMDSRKEIGSSLLCILRRCLI